MPHVRQRRALILAGVLVLLFAHGMLGLPLQLRSSSSALNHWLFAIAIVLLPVLAMYGAQSLSPRWQPRKLIFGAALFCVPCFLLAGLAVLIAPAFGESADFELISEGQAGIVAYRLYRSDCGATCATGLVLRSEFDLVPGIALVTSVWSMYRAVEGIVSVDASFIRVSRGNVVMAELAR